MATDAKIRRVARPRGELTAQQLRRLTRAADKRAAAEQAYRAEVVAIMREGASFPEMHNATGLSTNTLQRWRREAK